METAEGIGLRKISEELSYSDFTTSSTVYGIANMSQTIPAGSFVVGSKVTVLEAFSGGDNTTMVMDVGTSADDDLFSYTTHDISSVASNLVEGADSSAGGTTGTGLVPISSATTVQLKITVNSSYDTISAGQLIVDVYYLSTNPE